MLNLIEQKKPTTRIFQPEEEPFFSAHSPARVISTHISCVHNLSNNYDEE